MAEKGFGVKEINLIGASGTPTIESPNNLNLNAVNVAISTNVSIGGTLSVTGNVSVGGTLTYEDVTNIDSVGVITARSGVDVDDFISVGSNIHLGNAGVVTATSFSGSGANLTNLPADTPTDSDIQVAYTVTANGSSAYRFAGNGVVSTADDPDIFLTRGVKYRFINNSGGSHPFQIRVSDGGSAYSTGVTNNGAASGNIDFAPTFDSPSKLVYQCTSHSGMVGNIYMTGGVGRWIQQSIVTVQSGTEYEFTNIPDGVNEVMIQFNGISFNNAGNLKFILGHSGGYTTSGYNISRSYEPGGNYQKGTNGIEFNGTGSAGYYATGRIHLWAPIHSNEWWVEGTAYPDDNEGQYRHQVTGRGNVGGTLSKIKMTSDNNGTFDNTGNGKVQLSYIRY